MCSCPGDQRFFKNVCGDWLHVLQVKAQLDLSIFNWLSMATPLFLKIKWFVSCEKFVLSEFVTCLFKNCQENKNRYNTLCPLLAVSRKLLLNLQSSMLALGIDNEISNQTRTEIISGCSAGLVWFGFVGRRSWGAAQLLVLFRAVSTYQYQPDSLSV